MWDLIQTASLESKQFRIKEESQRLLMRTLNEYVINKENYIDILINIFSKVFHEENREKKYMIFLIILQRETSGRTSFRCGETEKKKLFLSYDISLLTLNVSQTLHD